jgi:hypothetical protein
MGEDIRQCNAIGGRHYLKEPLLMVQAFLMLGGFDIAEM